MLTAEKLKQVRREQLSDLQTAGKHMEFLWTPTINAPVNKEVPTQEKNGL